jgi:hypothetical protein
MCKIQRFCADAAMCSLGYATYTISNDAVVLFAVPEVWLQKNCCAL